MRAPPGSASPPSPPQCRLPTCRPHESRAPPGPDGRRSVRNPRLRQMRRRSPCVSACCARSARRRREAGVSGRRASSAREPPAGRRRAPREPRRAAQTDRLDAPQQPPPTFASPRDPGPARSAAIDRAAEARHRSPPGRATRARRPRRRLSGGAAARGAAGGDRMPSGGRCASAPRERPRRRRVAPRPPRV
jgi:hypothetical protein